jgi:hypothetical protein
MRFRSGERAGHKTDPLRPIIFNIPRTVNGRSIMEPTTYPSELATARYSKGHLTQFVKKFNILHHLNVGNHVLRFGVGLLCELKTSSRVKLRRCLKNSILHRFSEEAIDKM